MPILKRRWWLNVFWLTPCHWLQLGVHLDVRHPMLTLYLSRVQVNVGRFFVVSHMPDGTPLTRPCLCWCDPYVEAEIMTGGN